MESLYGYIILIAIVVILGFLYISSLKKNTKLKIELESEREKNKIRDRQDEYKRINDINNPGDLF